MGLVVDEDEFERADENGVVRKIKGSKPRRSGAYFDPADLGHRRNANGATAGFPDQQGGHADDRDEIPF